MSEVDAFMSRLMSNLDGSKDAEIKRLREALEQIAIVCTDNMDRNCDHRMALTFVRQVVNDAIDPVSTSGEPNGR